MTFALTKLRYKLVIVHFQCGDHGDMLSFQQFSEHENFSFSFKERPRKKFNLRLSVCGAHAHAHSRGKGRGPDTAAGATTNTGTERGNRREEKQRGLRLSALPV